MTMTPIGEVQYLQGIVEALMRATVADERAKGRTWREIGEDLGVTRATAHSKYSGYIGHPERVESTWELIADLVAQKLRKRSPLPPSAEERLAGLEAVVRLLAASQPALLSEPELPKAALRLIWDDSPPKD